MTAPRSPPLAEALAAFDELVGLEPAERQARLETMGASNPALRQAVDALVAADGTADAALQRLERCLGEPPRERDPLHLVGQTVGEFRILEPLGHGGMGVVYRAEDVRLGRAVALKFPLTSRLSDPAARERFRREARLAATLSHPNLCPVYATGETPEGELYYAMPLYEGESLKTRLERAGALSLPKALDVANQIAMGLGAAHDAGIVHRDLKPGNVMLLPDGGVRILDFGLAKVTDLSLTGSWARFGTIAYMAPEQVRGDPVDARADLWAIGVVLYELVTGRRPFAGGHEIGIAHAILHEEPEPPSALRDDVPAELDAVIGTLLRKHPGARYASTRELAAELAAVPLDGASARRRLRRWRTPLATATALATLAGVGLLAGRSAGAPGQPVALAVLPFERAGDSAATHHLAVGLGDAIGAELGRLRSVVAPSAITTSVFQDGTRPPREIAAELQVQALLRGSVRRLGDEVLVEGRLLDAEGQEIWTRSYQRRPDELPALVRDVVQSSLAALRVRSDPTERERLDRLPAVNAAAYELYLRGRAAELEGRSRELWAPMPVENARRAQSFYTQALARDPRFALARARLALIHTFAATMYDTSQARREQGRLEAEAALRLQPGLSEAHEALASYWELGGATDKALAELGLALRSSPNSADLHMALGGTLARAGRLDEAVVEFDQAMHLEPGSPRAAFAAAVFHLRLRRDEDAMRAFDRALALQPDYHMAKVIKGHTYLRWKGTPDTLAAAMETVPVDWDPQGMATWARYTALWAQRRYPDALRMLERSQARLSHDGLVYQPMPLMRARVYDAMGDGRSAGASYLEARELLEDSAAARPDDASVRIALGLAYAGLGRTADALREARRAMELVPVASNTPAATGFMGGAVEVFSRAGETTAALELVELLFSMPAGREVTVAYLRVWPGFDGLRADPRYDELLARYAKGG